MNRGGRRMGADARLVHGRIARAFALLLACGLVADAALAGPPTPAGLEHHDGGIIRGPKDRKVLALVFTAHEFAEGAGVILDDLANHHGKASFFLTGDFLANTNFALLARRMAQEGHYVGPHSDQHLLYCAWEDPHRTLLTHGAFEADLDANLEKLEHLGVARSQARFFLPAYEHYNAEIAQWSADLGLTLINFTPGTRSTADYTGETDSNFVSSKRIFDSIMAREKEDAAGLNGFILLLHLGAGPRRADKFHAHFAELLDYLTAKGYRCARVDELLTTPAKESPQTKTTDSPDAAPPAARVFIRASQIGYLPRDTKIAVAFSDAPLPSSVLLVAAASQAVVYQPQVRPVADAKWGQFEYHAELDFSAFDVPGEYILKVGEDTSLPFVISSNVYAGLPDELLEFMRQQRCGYNPWLDTACHTLDGRTAYGPLPGGTPLDVRGGWHDAADTLKYLLTSGNATAQMLLAYQLAQTLRPEEGATAQNAGGAPEPRTASTQETPGGASAVAFLGDHFDSQGRPGANGIPDLLDEARWGLDWLLKLHPAPKQLYHQVADDRDHIGRRLPHNDTADYGWGQGGARVVYYADGRPQGLGRYKSESTGMANLAGRYAAAMALAYQIWRADPSQRAFAERCLQAGKEVYELGRSHEGVQQGNSYGAPYRYAETTWADDMEWGAAELYRATGRRRYLTEARRYAKLAGSESWMGKEQTGHYQFYPFANLGHFRLFQILDPGRDEDRRLRETIAGYYREGIESCLLAGKKNPYRIGVPFVWCSNNLTVGLATQCALYEYMTGDHTYHEFAAKERDWLTGRNPWGYSMFTGIGAASPKDPHLMTAQLTGKPVRGGLVDGPVYASIFTSLKGVSIREPDPLALFQGQAVYHDDNRDYSSNEPTMDGTASAILLWTLCAAGR
jgi:peptidoglycan/xylan/chitin deacetylase (PgdA/CDA1 family)